MTKIFNRIALIFLSCCALLSLSTGAKAASLLQGQCPLGIYSTITSNTVYGSTAAGTFPLLPRGDLMLTITVTPPSTMATNYFSVSNIVAVITLGDGVNPLATIAPLTNTVTMNGTNVISQRFFWSATNIMGCTLGKVVGVTSPCTNSLGISIGYSDIGY